MKDSMLSLLIAKKMNIIYARGQGRDGASNMLGHLAGLATFEKIINPFAIYEHCMEHRIHIVTEKNGNDVAPYQDVLVILQKCCVFASSSPKRIEMSIDD